MPDDLLIARNPDPASSLPYLVRVPLGAGLVVKAKDTWPRAAKLYCHRTTDWPDDADIVERLPVRSVQQRGAAIDLVLTRARENRSQLVLTQVRGREAIFWQSARTSKQARPRIALPTARAHGQVLEIVVDSNERYGYTFGHQQATIRRHRLPAGDYAVFDGETLLATVERKSVEDLASSLLSGKLTYQLAELATRPRAAVVVEAGYSALFRHSHVAGSTLAEAVAEAQARFPGVPVVFCDNRKLAEEWTYRWLGACLAELRSADLTRQHLGTAASGEAIEVDASAAPDASTVHAEAVQADPGHADGSAHTEPSTSPTVALHGAVVDSAAARRWAADQGLDVAPRGRLSAAVLSAYVQAHRVS